ncbi:MAG: TolC family protein [Eubacteriales bacterium]|nr:TolC family protein [Eubacteriales bacterium]
MQNRNFSKLNKTKLTAFVLGIGLAGSALSCTAYAEAVPGALHTAEEMAHLSDDDLEWDEIDGLISEYNATVVKNRTEWGNDERRSYNSKQVSDYLIEKADEYDALYDEYADVSAMVAANYKTNADKMRLQAESNVSDFEVIKLSYDLVEKQTAESARKAFLNYYQSMYEKEYDDANAAYLEKLYASTVNRHNVGMATDMDVLTAKENLDTAKAAVLTAQSNIGSSRNALLVMCGWKYDSATAVIGALPSVSADEVSAISYEADMQKAKAANIMLKSDEIKLRNAKSGSYSSLVVEQNQNQLKDDTESFGINFKSVYDSYVNAAEGYTNAVNDKANAERNMAAADKQLSLGMLSNIEYEGKKNSLKAAELAERKAYIALISAKSAYESALGGNV